MNTSIPVHTSTIRRLDVRKDLLEVAELIELCFSNQMDPDGIEYIRQIRRAARDHSYLRWAPGSHENVSIPLDGYVWIEQNHIVGNLTLIPFLSGGKWRYLIANVAVHPDFRQLGIGRKLTKKAIEHIRDHMAGAAWLQVRDDNPVAIHLYESLGFQERARRTSWVSEAASAPPVPMQANIHVTPRQKTDWEYQKTWLNRIYPPHVAWNLPLRVPNYEPDFWHTLVHWMNGDKVLHWSARHSDQLLGVASVELSLRGSDNIWLAASPDAEDLAVMSLLCAVRNQFSQHHSLSVNYPAGCAVSAFQAAGFALQNTLIWMEIRFP